MKAGDENGHFTTLNGQDKNLISEHIQRCMRDPSTAPISAWNFVQALYHVDENAAIAKLRELAAEGESLAKVAQQTLAQVHP